jgi:putative ABC transport system permease protein
MNWALRFVVQPSYLRVTRIPLQRGRFFNEQDTPTSPRVIVVDDVFAAAYFPHQEALGERIRWGANMNDEAEIVGIVSHIKQWGLAADDNNSLRAQMYQDYDQQPSYQLNIDAGVIVRTSIPPLSLVPTLKQRVQQLNSENVIYSPTTMEQVISDDLSTRQFTMVLLGAFASLALALAAVGIYGVTAYLVGQRTPEFGIRMALGAQQRDVLALVMTEGARIASVGVVVGIVLALGITRLMTKVLFGVKPTDPITFGVVSAILGTIALTACYLPARRATRVDPMIALRCD